MTLNKIIETLRGLKSDLDRAFDEGKIDLDRISSGLEEVALNLESLEESLVAGKSTAQTIVPTATSLKTASKTQTIDVADYR